MIIKKENGEDATIILPFRTRRIERNNNNGVRKQARLEIRKRMINERVKQRARLQTQRKIEAIKELIEKGELPEDSLKWQTRNQKPLETAEQRRERRMKLRESGVDIKSEDDEAACQLQADYERQNA
jgi:hypothetical protein